MSDRMSGAKVESAPGPYYESAYDESSSFDVLGFFYRHRARLLVSFLVIFGMGVSGG